MRGRLGGDRRQVGDAQHLGRLRRAGAASPPPPSAVRPPMPASTSSNTSVRAGLVAGAERLEREHDPRQLAAGRDPRQRPGCLADVGREEELAAVDAAGAATPGAVSSVARRSSKRVPAIARSASSRSIAAAKRGPDPWRDADESRARRSRKRSRAASTAASAASRCRPVRRRARPAPVRARRPWPATSSSVGPCLRFSRSISASRSSTSCSRAGRGVETLLVVAQRQRQVLELGLDAVAGRERAREHRVDRRQLADPLPDLAEGRERRAPRRRRAGVGFAAQRGQPSGVPEHLAGLRQRRRPRRPQPRLLAARQDGTRPAPAGRPARRRPWPPVRASARPRSALPTRSRTAAASAVRARPTGRAAADG